MPRLRPLFGALALCVAPTPSRAQHSVPPDEPLSFSIGAQALAIVSHVSPAFVGQDYTEGYLTQPAIMAHARALGGRLTLRATLDFEGLTLRRGELTPGSYGEGYVDRRHPHTYAHELMATIATRGDAAASGGAPVALSLSAGRGFAPFGTDDPMMRPLVKFPANHHLSQILERATVIGAARWGAVIVEAGVFNGDEPTSPSSWPRWSRVGDSWSGRVTVAPRGGRLAGLEVQASRAWLTSPELRQGGGGDQRKWSTAARFERGTPGASGHRYALVEWARTDDVINGRRAFGFTTLLGEASVAAWRGSTLAFRYERTVRPEEERLADPFRTARPHTDASILGRTRWNTVTAHVSLPRLPVAGSLRATPLFEIARASVTEVDRPSAFEPALFYGSSTPWTLTAGIRLEVGALHRRMGRYGVAESGAESHDMHDMHGMHDASDTSAGSRGARR